MDKTVYILEGRKIRVEWTILKGTSPVREDFKRALVKVFLIGNREKYLLEATAERGTLMIDIPEGLEPGLYSLEAIWVKNAGHPGRHDCDLCRSMKQDLFAITEFEEEATNLPEGTVVLKAKSSTATYGYDGLSSYELAVLRGEWNGTEGEWLKHQRYVSVLDGRGDSETDTMSQKAITDELEKHDKSIEDTNKEIESAQDDIKDLNDEMDEVQDRLAYIPKESFLSSEPACDYHTDDNQDELTVSRAIKDRFGRIIDEHYVTRETVKDYTQEVVDGSKLEIQPGSVQPEDLSPAVRQMIESSAAQPGHITNLPDEEDLTVTEHNTLQFKDREYNPYNYSGMGKVYLRKHIVNGTNMLTQHMMRKPNTIYVIRYDYCLGGETIEVPENCVLQFEGGSLRNGTVVGNNTNIKNTNDCIFSNIDIDGSWSLLSYSKIEWFKHTEKEDISRILENCITFFKKVKLNNSTYYIKSNEQRDSVYEGAVNVYNLNGIELIGDEGATIVSLGGGGSSYKVSFFECNNIVINGITFDSNNKARGSLSINDCDDVLIQNCKFKNHYSNDSDYYNTDSQVCITDSNRKKILNCYFYNVGYDISETDHLIRCITDQGGIDTHINNCIFEKCNQAIVAYAENTIIENCFFREAVHNGIYAFKKEIKVLNNTFNNVAQPVTWCDTTEEVTERSVCIISNNFFIDSINRVIRLNGKGHTLKILNNIMIGDAQFLSNTHDAVLNFLIIDGNTYLNEVESTESYIDYIIYLERAEDANIINTLSITNNQFVVKQRSSDFFIRIGGTYEDVTISNNLFKQLNSEPNNLIYIRNATINNYFEKGNALLNVVNGYPDSSKVITNLSLAGTGDSKGITNGIYRIDGDTYREPYKVRSGDLFIKTENNHVELSEAIVNGTRIEYKPIFNTVSINLSDYLISSLSGTLVAHYLKGGILRIIGDLVSSSTLPRYSRVINSMPNWVNYFIPNETQVIADDGRNEITFYEGYAQTTSNYLTEGSHIKFDVTFYIGNNNREFEGLKSPLLYIPINDYFYTSGHGDRFKSIKCANLIDFSFGKIFIFNGISSGIGVNQSLGKVIPYFNLYNGTHVTDVDKRYDFYIDEGMIVASQLIPEDVEIKILYILGSNQDKEIGDKNNLNLSNLLVGQYLYDTTLNKPIWWTGSKWVDATGVEV